MDDGPLVLHEVVDIVGTGTWPYMEHTLAATGDEKVGFALQGTFAIMGVTGRWPQVVNLWDVPGGWDGWRDAIERLNLARRDNSALDAWWRTAYEHRSGGVDRLLAGVPGCPTTVELVAAGMRAPLFVHELTEVKPGAQRDYLTVTREQRVPLFAEYGYRLAGLYEVLLNDVEVVTIWATSPEEHVRLVRADHTGDDARLRMWRATASQLTTRRREELMTPCPGIPIGPPAPGSS